VTSIALLHSVSYAGLIPGHLAFTLRPEYAARAGVLRRPGHMSVIVLFLQRKGRRVVADFFDLRTECRGTAGFLQRKVRRIYDALIETSLGEFLYIGDNRFSWAVDGNALSVAEHVGIFIHAYKLIPVLRYADGATGKYRQENTQQASFSKMMGHENVSCLNFSTVRERCGGVVFRADRLRPIGWNLICSLFRY
jgi:hypothetical protein